MQTPSHAHTLRFVGASFFTFVLLSMLILAVLLLICGVLLQLGALLVPFLVSAGWTLLKVAVVLLVLLRTGLLLLRLGRILHHFWLRQADYQELLLLLRGTLYAIGQGLLWLLFR